MSALTRLTDDRSRSTIVWLGLMCAAAGTLAVVELYRLSFYFAIPADLLSFSESLFISDLVKLRLGVPLYSPPQDNSNFPYTPGAPLLTYAIASLFGAGESIPALRIVQFSYVALACAIATATVDRLARLTLGSFRHRPAWLLFGGFLTFLVATDDRFNAFVHSLHNDGMALLVSAAGYWLIVRHAMTRERWLVWAMAALPALGFLVKQNQLMWAGVFGLYLIGIGGVPRRTIAAYAAGAIGGVALAVGLCYLAWGDNFLWWIFVAIGSKEISPARTAFHLFQAGGYAVMALAAGWTLAFRPGARPALVLWLCWLVVFALQVYTTGVAWSLSHIGPGALLAACWFVVALAAVWPQRSSAEPRWTWHARQAAAASIAVLLLGLFGFVREPRNPVPPDLARYIADIEREFEDLPAEKVLLDIGTWIYARENVVMKDQSSAVAIHHGPNQETINQWALEGTIDRLRRRVYARILAHELDTPRSSYDFLDRGSGVKQAIFDNYAVVRRIPAVQGVTRWWPMHLVGEVLVLEPRREAGSAGR